MVTEVVQELVRQTEYSAGTVDPSVASLLGELVARVEEKIPGRFILQNFAPAAGFANRLPSAENYSSGIARVEKMKQIVQVRQYFVLTQFLKCEDMLY